MRIWRVYQQRSSGETVRNGRKSGRAYQAGQISSSSNKTARSRGRSQKLRWTLFSRRIFRAPGDEGALQRALGHAWRALRRGGLLIAMGPNIRYLPGAYWDFIDHHIALSDRSIVEAMEIAGFSRRRVVDRFLPYTMSEGSRPAAFIARWPVSAPALSVAILWQAVSRRHGKGGLKLLSIVIPVRNEAENIRTLFDSLALHVTSGGEGILVYDAEDDPTIAEAHRETRSAPVRTEAR